MLNSSKRAGKSRIQRGAGPKQKLRRHNYRQRALSFLLADFENRCAYSMQHKDRAGLTSMEVDHFNPTLPFRTRNHYANLFLSTRHCNNAKRKYWPSASQIGRGIRFLNCCEEWDYGVHIFEHPTTHRLFGVTPAGRYHIRMCDLNAPHFVRERRDRATLNQLLTKQNAVIRDLARAMELVNLLRVLRGISVRMIPTIPSEPIQSEVVV